MMRAEYPPDPCLSLRAATPADAPCLAALARVAMSDDPAWDYRFPHRFRFPDDHRRWTERSYEGFFEQPARYRIDVVVAADNEAGSDIPIAFAVWIIDANVPPLQNDLGVPFDETQPVRRRDVNPAHFRAFRAQIPVGDDTFLGHYGAARLQLKILGTHPLFRHRGAASMLVCAGLERARAQGVPTTVLASPMGYKLYISLGFKAVGMFIVRIEGEEEKLDIGAMEHRGGLWSLVGKSKCEEKFEAELSAQG